MYMWSLTSEKWLLPELCGYCLVLVLKYWFWHDTVTTEMTERQWESATTKENKCKGAVKFFCSISSKSCPSVLNLLSYRHWIFHCWWPTQWIKSCFIISTILSYAPRKWNSAVLCLSSWQLQERNEVKRGSWHCRPLTWYLPGSLTLACKVLRFCMSLTAFRWGLSVAIAFSLYLDTTVKNLFYFC